jgi:DNA modification methylase
MREYLPITDIVVGERQREDYGDLPDLANSLADERYGQLQPVIVDRQNKHLLAGGRRLAAAALLAAGGGGVFGNPPGTVWIEYKDTTSPEHAEAIELEENIRRKQLEWQEEQKAISKIHSYKQKENPEWSADETAALIGKSRRSVYNAIELAKEIDKDENIAKADTPSGAMKRLERKKQLAKRESEINTAALARGLGFESKVKAEIIHGDALEGMMELETESVDAVIFNPPFGVEIETLFTSGKKIYQNDDPHNMTALTNQIVEQAYRVLKPDRWMVMFYPTVRLEDVKGVGPAMWESIKRRLDLLNQQFLDNGLAVPVLLKGLEDDLEDICGGMLRRHGFNFQQVPCQWIKPNKRVSALGDPYAQLNINYETFYFARKGKAIFRQIPHSTTFTYDTPGVGRIHPLEMPVDLWKEIFQAICVGGESVVEPFAGSGAGGDAAVQCGLNYTGWELDGEFALHSQTRLVGALAGAMHQPKTNGNGNGNAGLMVGKHGLVTIDTSALSDDIFED